MKSLDKSNGRTYALYTMRVQKPLRSLEAAKSCGRNDGVETGRVE
jgi:hypothetical protein